MWSFMAYKIMYMRTERKTARAASNQKRTRTARLSHNPVLPKPYSTMLIRIVPKETATAGTKSDSVGCVKDARKVYGYK